MVVKNFNKIQKKCEIKLKVGKLILEKDSWVVYLIPRSSNMNALGR